MQIIIYIKYIKINISKKIVIYIKINISLIFILYRWD